MCGKLFWEIGGSEGDHAMALIREGIYNSHEIDSQMVIRDKELPHC